MSGILFKPTSIKFSDFAMQCENFASEADLRDTASRMAEEYLTIPLAKNVVIDTLPTVDRIPTAQPPLITVPSVAPLLPPQSALANLGISQPAIAKEAMISVLLEMLKGQGVKLDGVSAYREQQPSSSSAQFTALNPQISNSPGSNQCSAKVQISNVLFPYPLPLNSSHRLYVDGIPPDTREREIAHIFRPYPGFRSIRLVPQENRSGRKFVYCFVDFETAEQSTVVLHNLQGYRFHWRDKKGLRINYANPNPRRPGDRDGQYGEIRTGRPGDEKMSLGKRKLNMDFAAEMDSYERDSQVAEENTDLSKVTTW